MNLYKLTAVRNYQFFNVWNHFEMCCVYMSNSMIHFNFRTLDIPRAVNRCHQSSTMHQTWRVIGVNICWTMAGISHHRSKQLLPLRTWRARPSLLSVAMRGAFFWSKCLPLIFKVVSYESETNLDSSCFKRLTFLAQVEFSDPFLFGIHMSIHPSICL